MTSCACRASRRWANYLVREIQDVYRLQGVKINDKHIEVIIRQMLRKTEVQEAGETALLRGEQLDRSRAARTSTIVRNTAARRRHGCSRCCWHHQGLAGDRVVHLRGVVPGDHPRADRSRGAGLKDDLRGLKENVIVGRLIPAGTGFAAHASRRRKMEGADRRSFMDVGGGLRMRKKRASAKSRRAPPASAQRWSARPLPTRCAKLERAGEPFAGPFF